MLETKTTFSRLYQKWQQGDPEAQEQLIRLVYRDLHRMAQHLLRKELNAVSLQPTLLANEACLRLLQLPHTAWEDRRHFFNAAAKRMRELLIDHARTVRAQKRLTFPHLTALEEAGDLFTEINVDLFALDEALRQFEAIDPRGCQIVELRFFFGATINEVAEVFGIAPITVRREWEMARLWLLDQLASSSREDPPGNAHAP